MGGMSIPDGKCPHRNRISRSLSALHPESAIAGAKAVRAKIGDEYLGNAILYVYRVSFVWYLWIYIRTGRLFSRTGNLSTSKGKELQLGKIGGIMTAG